VAQTLVCVPVFRSLLSACDPGARVFPLDWKVAFHRLNGGSDSGYAHGDHVTSIKAGDLTT